MSVSRKQIKAERRQRRDFSEQSRLVEQKLQQRRRNTILALGSFGALMLVALFAVLALTQASDPELKKATVDRNRRAPDTTSVGFADQGNQHIASPTTPHTAYNSDPPTSGPHLEGLGPEGWQEVSAVSKEQYVHNLEDGGIVIYYKPDLDQGQKDQLRNLVESLGSKVTAAPYPGLKTPIALTAWTRLDELPSFDETRIRNFVEAYRGLDHHKR